MDQRDRRFSEQEHEGDISSVSADAETLPEELMQQVLARLPLSSFLRLRSVCKTWNNLAYDLGFLQNFTNTLCRTPLFITQSLSGCVEYATYNSDLEKWKPTLPDVLALKDPSRGQIPVASAGGLVLWETGEIREAKVIDQRSLWVSNPFIKIEKQLPASQLVQSRIFHAAIALDRETSAYRVLVLGGSVPDDYGDDEGLYSEVYDSRTHSWVGMGVVPKEELDGIMNVSCALQKENLYCLLNGATGSYMYVIGNRSPSALCWYEMDVDLTGGGQCQFAVMFESSNRLMIGVQVSPLVSIFEVNVENEIVQQLHEVDSMDLSGIPHFSYSVFSGCQDYTFQLIFPISLSWASQDQQQQQDVHMLVRENYSGRVRLVSGHPFVQKALCRSFVYEPRLDLLV